MPKREYRTTPVVFHPAPTLYQEGPAVRLDTSEGAAWLRGAALFAVRTPDLRGGITFRAEKRGEQYYWRAFQRRDGRLRVRYVGKEIDWARICDVVDYFLALT